MGDESLCNYLRVCVSIELYLEGNYYVEQPYTVFETVIYTETNYVSSMSLSNEATFELQNSHESKTTLYQASGFHKSQFRDC